MAAGCRSLVIAAAVVVIAALSTCPVAAQALDRKQREALLTLLDAVDRTQRGELATAEEVDWAGHVFKGVGVGYVPFSLPLVGPLGSLNSVAMYVRAVLRRDGPVPPGQHSELRDRLQKNPTAAPRGDVVGVGAGEMPVGGPATRMGTRAQQAALDASTALQLQEKAYERERLKKERDPLLFPFEDYDFADVKPRSANEPRLLERALALPPGAYDVYIALLDRSQKDKGAVVVTRRTVLVPDFWNRELSVSSLLLVADVHALSAPLKPAEQRQHPYAFGGFEARPVSAWYGKSDVLTVVFQICNYSAPDSDLTIDYEFFREAGDTRQFFNRTAPQRLTDTDLPAPALETQTFASQSVPLQSFPAGRYELRITVRDSRRVSTTIATTEFTVIGSAPD